MAERLDDFQFLIEVQAAVEVPAIIQGEPMRWFLGRYL